MDRITADISDYAAALTFADLPDDVVHHAKRLLIDTLGCAIGGYHSEPARVARALAGLVTSRPPATVLGSGQQTSLDLATFANGVMIRYLDFNDGYNGRETGHPSDAIAAVLSPGEVVRASGRQILTATVLAYEVFCRFCDAICVRERGFDHVTLGVIASTMGAAKVMGISRDHIAQALCLGTAPNMALYQTRIGDVSLWKGCAFANASRNAVFAVQLAAQGLTGPSPVFEGAGGFARAMGRDALDLAPFGGGNVPFKMAECTIKRFPLGLHSQTVVDAALRVREQLPDIGTIQDIHVHTQQAAVDIMAGDAEKWRPANRETADHSIPYTVAVGLMYGDVNAQYFDDVYLHDPALLNLVQKVQVHVSEEANRRAPEALLSMVEVTTTSGDHYRAEVPYHRGHWKNPMTDAEIEAKFRALASGVLAPQQADTLLDRLWHLEQVEDIGDVIRTMHIEQA